MRTGRGSAEQSSLPSELLLHVPALPGQQPVGISTPIEVTARCVRMLTSGSWPFLANFRDVG